MLGLRVGLLGLDRVALRHNVERELPRGHAQGEGGWRPPRAYPLWHKKTIP